MVDELGNLKFNIIASLKDFTSKMGEFERILKGSEEQTKKTGMSWTQMFTSMTAANLAADALSKLKQVAFDSVKEFDNMAVSLARLRVSIGDHVGDLVRLAEAKQVVTRVSKEESLAAMQVLTVHKLNSKQIQDLIPVIMDYAAKTGQTIESTARSFGYAIEYGTTRGLRPFGLQIEKNMSQQEVFNYLLKQGQGEVKGFAEKIGQLGTGPLISVQNQLKDQEDELGEQLIPLWVTFAKVLSNVVLPAIQGALFAFKTVSAVSVSFMAGIGALFSKDKHVFAEMQAAFNYAVDKQMKVEGGQPSGNASGIETNKLGTTPINPGAAKTNPALTSLQTSLEIYRKEMQLAFDTLESLYKQDEFSLKDYFDGKKALIEEEYNEELDYLKEEMALTDDANKIIEIRGKMDEAEIEKKSKLIKLTEEYTNELKKENRAKQEAESTVSSLEAAPEAYGTHPRGTSVEELKKKHAADSLKWEKEILKALVVLDNSTGKERLKLQAALLKTSQDMEKSDLEFKKQLAREEMLYRLDVAGQISSGTGKLMGDLYELSGNKIAAFFYLQQMASATNAIMSGIEGKMKAMATVPPPWGQILGGIIFAEGIASAAAIMMKKPPKAESGGIIYGDSHASGGVNINAEGGEGIINKRAVGFYGYEAINAVNSGSATIMTPEGATRGTGGSRNTAPRQPAAVILNTLDPALMGRYLAGAEGQRVLVNVIRAQRQQIKRVL